MKKLDRYEAALRKTFPEVVLLGHKEVGYPLYRARLNLALRKDRDLLLQEEYVLRALETKLNSREEIGRFLGVEAFFVDKTLSGLLSNELAQRTADGLEATASGRRALDKQVVDDIAIESTQVLIDALTGDVHVFDEFPLNHVKRPDYTISPVVPRVQDEVTDFVPYLERIQGALNRGKEDVELISIESVDWTSQVWHQLDFVTFRATPTADDVRYVFFLNRNIEPTYRERIERLQAEGHDVLEHLLGEDLVTEEERTEQSEVRQLIDLPEEVITRAETVKAELQASQVRKAESSEGGGRREATDEDVEVLQRRIKELKAELDGLQQTHQIGDIVHTPELRRYLMKALNEAEDRLLIISPWIRNIVVNDKFATKLERALRRGVRVTVLYGYKEHKKGGRPSNDHQAVSKLQKLNKEYEGFTLQKVLNTHSKVLVCDRKFGISSSFNFLSFRADPNRTYRDETGIVVRVDSLIDDLYQHGEDLLKEASYITN